MSGWSPALLRPYPLPPLPPPPVPPPSWSSSLLPPLPLLLSSATAAAATEAAVANAYDNNKDGDDLLHCLLARMQHWTIEQCGLL